MKYFFDFIKKHKWITFWSALIIFVGVPIVIHCCFKLDLKSEFFSVNWTAGDVLQYYAAVLVGCATVILALVSIEQTNQANSLSQKLLQTEELSNRTFVMLEKELTQIDTFNEAGDLVVCLTLGFKNLSKLPISKLEVHRGITNLYNNVPFAFETNETVEIPKSIKIVLDWEENEEMDAIKRRVRIVPLYPLKKAILLEIDVYTTNILGVKTRQVFNIMLNPCKDKYLIVGHRSSYISD